MGKPTDAWAKRPEHLRGPGIYALFCRSLLVYVGLYTGSAKQTFSGTVIERWKKHLTYFAMRNPELSFSQSNLHRVLTELQGPAIEEITEKVGRRTFTREERAEVKIPLNDGSSCTFYKACYAVQNWDLFRPSNEAQMLAELSFAYARFQPCNAELLGAEARTNVGKKWAHDHWLRPREEALINRFTPICNDVDKPDPLPEVTEEQFMLALIAEMNRPLPPLVPMLGSRAA